METTLFNKNGKPVAYLADDGGTIYLWDGRAAAYLSGERVSGWNGRPLGWFIKGTFFDIYGLRAGFIKGKSPITTDMEPVKPAKRMKKEKGARQSPVAKPVMCYGYSNKSLEEILESGIGL